MNKTFSHCIGIGAQLLIINHVLTATLKARMSNILIKTIVYITSFRPCQIDIIISFVAQHEQEATWWFY